MPARPVPGVDAVLDDLGAVLPGSQVGCGVAGLLQAVVLVAACLAFLFQLVVDAGERGDRLEDPPLGDLIQRLGEQVRG